MAATSTADPLTPLVDAVAQRVAELLTPLLAASPPDTTPWLDVRGAAQHAAMPVSAIDAAAEAGQIQAARSGRRLRFRREWVDAFVEGRSV
jgi:excisionase family DNA binding protein